MNNKSLNDFLNIDFANFADFLSSISPLQLGAIGSLIGTLLCVPLNYEEQNVLGNFFELVGQVMLVVAAQNANLDNQKPANNSQALMDIQKQIDQLNRKIDDLYQRY